MIVPAQKNQLGLLARLTAILKFIEGENGSDRPDAVIRPMLPEALRVTQAELLETLGVKRRKKLGKKLSHAVRVVARIHTGKDCYRTIGVSLQRVKAAIENMEQLRNRDEVALKKSFKSRILTLHRKINAVKRELNEKPLGPIDLDEMSIDQLKTTAILFEEDWNGCELRFEDRISMLYRTMDAKRLPKVCGKHGMRPVNEAEYFRRELERVVRNSESKRVRKAA